MSALNQISFWLAYRLSNPASGFSPATTAEPTVFGARRPGFPFPRVSPITVNTWVQFMHLHHISRVVCLLPQRQLDGYGQLLKAYKQGFGAANVCWSPINDFKLAGVSTLTQVIIPFLADTNHRHERVVVHCSGGVGRTGHILAAWLVSFRGMSNEEAIQAVRKTGRNSRESQDPTLDQLLDTCRRVFAT